MVLRAEQLIGIALLWQDQKSECSSSPCSDKCISQTDDLFRYRRRDRRDRPGIGLAGIQPVRTSGRNAIDQTVDHLFSLRRWDECSSSVHDGLIDIFDETV